MRRIRIRQENRIDGVHVPAFEWEKKYFQHFDLIEAGLSECFCADEPFDFFDEIWIEFLVPAAIK